MKQCSPFGLFLLNLPILHDDVIKIMYGKVCSVHVKIEMLKEIEVILLSGVKFIHAADLHLDSPFSGLKDMPSSILKELRESPFKAFQTIINEAISRRVDFIVLSGDLFDGENRVSGHRFAFGPKWKSFSSIKSLPISFMVTMITSAAHGLLWSCRIMSTYFQGKPK